MFINRFNQKFSDFYKEYNLERAKTISKEILEMLDNKGLKPFESADKNKSIYVHAFDDYFSTFDSKPNPNKRGLEIMRNIILNDLKHEN